MANETDKKAGPAMENSTAGKPGAPLPATDSSQTRPVLFGGHKGGKKTLSGFPVDSPEHAEWVRERERQRSERRRKEAAALRPAATLPAALPSAGAGVAAVPSPALPGNLPAPGAPDPALLAAAPSLGGAVVAWTGNVLKKPAALIVRVIDRLRQNALFKKVDKSNLPKDLKEEIKKGAEWQDTARKDFADSLAEVAAIELNRFNVPSGGSHWITLSISAGELALAHLELSSRIDKMILEFNNQASAAKPAQVGDKVAEEVKV